MPSSRVWVSLEDDGNALERLACPRSGCYGHQPGKSRGDPQGSTLNNICGMPRQPSSLQDRANFPSCQLDTQEHFKAP
jgi:hypothetical protein